MLVKFEGVEGSAKAGLEVALQGVNPAELRKVPGVPPVTTALLWQLAAVTAQMKARPSESIWLPGARVSPGPGSDRL